jgi:DNA-directed RNA polymerase sigma subunit (sigma70/sigma32)
VIELRFGLVDGKEYTKAATARELGVSGERVHQLEDAALRRLRGTPQAETLSDAA